VGWYALKKHLFNNPSKSRNRNKIIYTSPIKTLSNEKFEEMTEYLAGYGIVPGLLTGDHRVNVDSDFLIMTAEILSNALFRLKSDSADKNNQFELDTEFINSISCVIMDEIHFISDESRGHVWENSIILLEPEVQLIGLSATIDQPEMFASWISSIRNKPISLIKKYDRPVPLEYRMFDGTDAHVIMGIDGKYDHEAWKIAINNNKEMESYHKLNKTDKRLDMLRTFIDYAGKNKLMQLCFIIFSKRNCERFAEQITDSLLTGQESALAINALHTKLGVHLKNQETMPRFQQIKKLIQKGVCFHHAGMPVILKEVVEYLYKNQYIKALFATETVAIGVNMPVRTIVFTSLEKSTGSTMRYVNAAEFKQICGRAGRRGIDTLGTVVFLPLYGCPDERTIKDDLLYGSMPKIESKLNLTYQSYLKTEVSTAIDKDNYFNKSLLKIHTDQMEIANRSDEMVINAKILDLHQKRDLVIVTNNIGHEDYDTMCRYSANTKKINPTDTVKFSMTGKQRKKHEKDGKIAKKYPSLIDILDQIDLAEKELRITSDQIEYYNLYKDDRYGQIREFLKRMDYLDSEYNMTEYGIMIANINECNPFILAEIFTGNILQKCSLTEVVAICAILTDPITSKNKMDRTLNSINTTELVKDAIRYIDHRVEVYRKTEEEIGVECSKSGTNSDNYWSTSLDYIEIVQVWCNTDPEIDTHSKILCKLNEIEEYEGSFIKNMLKINTIVSNLIGLANITNNFELIPKLEQIESLIIKGIVNTDSLHVNV
jgi:superfamily II RNA helicase